jgi:hypothetical protein
MSRKERAMITRRRMFAAAGGLAALAAAGSAAAETPTLTAPTKRRTGTMDIKRSGWQPSGKGPAEYFTGTVRIDPLIEAPEPARVFGASVTFEPGARTAWHTHPLGQTLIVTFGLGWVQRWGRSQGGNPTRRCRLVPTRRKALARRHGEHGHDPHRHCRTAKRQKRRLDGKGQ